MDLGPLVATFSTGVADSREGFLNGLLYPVLHDITERNGKLWFALLQAHRDWIAIVRRYGEMELGFQFPKHTFGEEDIWLASRMSRAPAKVPRTIELAADFVVPDEHTLGWSQLRAKIEAGEDLLPHLSRGVRKVGARDGMLNHWRINHFHLGVGPDPKHPGMIEGTREILYASFLGDKFLALRIDEHDRWSDKPLLQALVDHWPNHPDIVRGMALALNYSDKDEEMLRASNIVVPTRLRDGIHFMSGDETLGGSATHATMLATGLRGKIARFACGMAKQHGAGGAMDDVCLVVDEDWALHLELPKLQQRVSLTAAPGTVFTVPEIVESWRS